KSTVDFDGTYKSMSLYYEAKTTSKPYFPLENVSNHQVEHLIKQANVGALCFFLVHFEKTQDTYVFPLQSLLYYWSRWKAKKRGYRHIPIDDFNTYAFKVKNTARARLDYLNQVDTLIKLLEEKDEA
ncbi:recombination protein U, partial [Evansella vedderi]